MDAAAATLRPCEVDVTLGGIVYTVPALSAVDWLTAVIGEPGAILPGLLDMADQREVHHRLLRGQITVDEVNRAWRDLISAVCGRSWWSAWRLCRSASDPDAWPVVHGRLLRSGVDLDRVSIGALCNAIFSMMMTYAADEDERSRIRFELELPPPGEDVEVFEDRERIAEDFLANLRTLQQFG